MNRIPRWLAFLLGAGMLAAVIGGISFYSLTKQPDGFITQKMIKPLVGLISGIKKFEEVADAKPAFTLSANELQSAFAKDEAKAMEMYNSQIIQVNGSISRIAAPTDTNRVILLEVDGLSNISCQMDPRYNERLADVSPGSKVTVRGICNGSKMDDLLGSIDVLLNRCVLVN